MNKRVLLTVAMLSVAHAHADFLREWVKPTVFHASRLAAGILSGIIVDHASENIFNSRSKDPLTTIGKLYVGGYLPEIINQQSNNLPQALSWLKPYNQDKRAGAHLYWIGLGAQQKPTDYLQMAKDLKEKIF